MPPPKRAPPSPPRREEPVFRPAGPAYPDEPQVPPPRPTNVSAPPASGANRVPIPKQPVVLTKNPNPPYMREWPEIVTKMNLAHADDLAIDYEVELHSPYDYDVDNEFGFLEGVLNRAEQKRFDLVVSDYAIETCFHSRWDAYRSLIEELRSEERPERYIQEELRKLARDWLMEESEERVELRTAAEQEKLKETNPNASRRDLERLAAEVRRKGKNVFSSGEEEARRRRMAGQRETRFRIPGTNRTSSRVPETVRR